MAGFTKYLNDLRNNAPTTKLEGAVRSVVDVVDSVGARTKALRATRGFGNSVNSSIGIIKEARKQYNYRVKLNFGTDSSKGIEANIKSITRPSVHFDYSETNVFNSIKRTIIGVTFDPIVLEIYDDLAGSVTDDIIKMLKNDYMFNIDNQLVDGAPIDLAPYQKAQIKSIEIHSGSAPLNNLVGGVLNNLSNGGTGIYNEGNITNMVRSQCTIDSIDFGNFDYSNEADPCVIRMTFKYQSLSFGRTSLTKDLAEFAGERIYSRL